MKKDAPLCLRIEEAKKEIASVINRQRHEKGIPFYLLELIVKDIYSQVVDGKNTEIAVISRDFENSKESEEGEGE